MQQFLSPHLVSVLFSDEGEMGPDSDSTLITTISLLPTTRLGDLNLNIFPPPTLMHSVLSKVVQRLNPRFKRLMTESSLSESAWEHLASLPKLEFLRVSDTPRTEISKAIPHEIAFPALERMEIKVGDAHQHWSFLFSLLKSSPLRDVRVALNRRIRGVDVPGQVTAAVLEAGLQRNIDTLIFVAFNPDKLTFLSKLGPFCSLKTLNCVTECQWSGECVSPLTDLDIEQVARGFPQLEMLRLGHGCKHSPYHTTIKSLISLSTHCLSLDTLYLPCDLTNISEDVKVESGEPDPRLGILSLCQLRVLALHWVIMPRRDDTKALGAISSAFRHLFPLLSPGLTIDPGLVRKFV